ncbi:hypothetical protein CALVIDRAFT_33479 [Calocera viscosa TUFC12733]|uniref:BRCT domain-containing protein n=1 Tax=Calocera viscosa (strain TUFC12733) TaxID=1330018 RepID=A0A167FQM3_CALVF|nr:hypothetical protein CALVIDRAFT_33479 [Calocera viscosa TUFC12733]
MDAIDAPDVDEFNPTLFRKKNGVPIPFVIDGPPNITHENRVALSEWITGSGGSVVDALPTSDPCFFVFDADVSKDNAIKLCTKTTQHPVHFSWIITSIEENKRAKWWLPMPDEPKPLRMAILTHINTTKRILEDFVTEHKGYQLPVYIDYSIQGEDRQQLAKLVNKHGGFPTLFEDQARIILADQSNEDWYEHIWGEDGVFSRIRSSDCWIESPSALRRWIRDRNVNLTPVRKPTASPRRKPSALRTEFTMSDDRLLVIYLAKTAPFGGGRQGNNIYHQLEENLQRDAAKAEKKSEETRTTEVGSATRHHTAL